MVRDLRVTLGFKGETARACANKMISICLVKGKHSLSFCLFLFFPFASNANANAFIIIGFAFTICQTDRT